MIEHIIDPDFYKELYYKEIQVRSTIDEQIDDVTQVIVVISGALYFLAQHSLSKTIDTPVYPLILALVTVTGGLLIRAMYFDALAAINSKIGGHYKGVPRPLQLLQQQKNIYNKIKQESEDLELSKVRDHVELEFNRELVKVYAQIADHNQKVNDERLKNIYSSKVSIIYALIALAIFAAISTTTGIH